MSEKEDAILWCKRDSKGKKSLMRHIQIADVRCSHLNLQVLDVCVGANSTEVLRKNKVPLELDDLVFSLVTKNRTLDLQARDRETRNLWVK